MPISGYGVDIQADGTNSFGQVPALRPVVAAIYIPPGSAEPGVLSLSSNKFGGQTQDVVVLHVSYGPMTLDDLAAAVLPVAPTPQKATFNTVTGYASLLARGQRLTHLVNTFAADGNTNNARPFTLKLDGHPGDPEKDGLLVVAQCPADVLLTLALAPLPGSRGKGHAAFPGFSTRDELVDGGRGFASPFGIGGTLR